MWSSKLLEWVLEVGGGVVSWLDDFQTKKEHPQKCENTTALLWKDNDIQES